jgi:hypothetical protein
VDVGANSLTRFAGFKPIYIEFVDDENGNGESRHVGAIADAVRFLNHWLTDRGMPRDNDNLIRVAAHANNAQHAALRLMRPMVTRECESSRRVVGES